jgi:putative acetyltransferase
MFRTCLLCPSDLEAVLAVHRAAFGRGDEAELVRRLCEAGDNACELMAEAETGVIGHVVYSPCRIEHGDDGRVLGLAPVAVLPTWQRQGVGTALINQSLDAMRAEGRVRAVVVLGEPDYYSRFGFTPASRVGLHDIYGGGDAFMVLALQPGGLNGYQGRVNYAPAFDSLTD